MFTQAFPSITFHVINANVLTIMCIIVVCVIDTMDTTTCLSIGPSMGSTLGAVTLSERASLVTWPQGHL